MNIENSEQLKQYQSAIIANRQAAKSSKYITEFRMCIIPSRKRTLLTSFAHTVVKANDDSVVVNGSICKNITIALGDEFFLTVLEYKLAEAVIESIMEAKKHEKAYTFQVYVISNIKVDEYRIGFAIKSIASSKLSKTTKRTTRAK